MLLKLQQSICYVYWSFYRFFEYIGSDELKAGEMSKCLIVFQFLWIGLTIQNCLFHYFRYPKMLPSKSSLLMIVLFIVLILVYFIIGLIVKSLPKYIMHFNKIDARKIKRFDIVLALFVIAILSMTVLTLILR